MQDMAAWSVFTVLAAEAYPPEGPVAVVEELRPHDVLHIAGEDEAVLGVAVAGNVRIAGIIDRLQVRIAVVEEVRAALHQGADGVEVAAQALVHQRAEVVWGLVQHGGALLEAEADGAIATVIHRMARGLVGQQVDGDVLLDSVLQQVHDVAVVGNGNSSAFAHGFVGLVEGFVHVVCHAAHPALAEACLDARAVHLGNDGRRACHFGRLGLGTAHTAQAGGDEQPPPEIAVLWDAQLEASGIQQGVERAVHDALRADVHPAAGGHLSIVGYAQLHGGVPVFLVVIESHHQGVRDDDARGFGMGLEESQRMATLHDQGLVLCQFLQVHFEEAILHPVLADLARLAVGHQLVGIEGYVESQVVVYHHLESLSLDALAFVLVDGFRLEVSFRAEAVAVDAAPGAEFLKEFGCQLFVQFVGDVAQGVLQGRGSLRGIEGIATVGCPPDAFDEGRVGGQLVAKVHSHGLGNILS